MNLDQPPKPNQEQAFYKSLVEGKSRFTIEGKEATYSGVNENSQLVFTINDGESLNYDAKEFFQLNQDGKVSKIFEVVTVGEIDKRPVAEAENVVVQKQESVPEHGHPELPKATSESVEDRSIEKAHESIKKESDEKTPGEIAAEDAARERAERLATQGQEEKTKKEVKEQENNFDTSTISGLEGYHQQQVEREKKIQKAIKEDLKTVHTIFSAVMLDKQRTENHEFHKKGKYESEETAEKIPGRYLEKNPDKLEKLKNAVGNIEKIFRDEGVTAKEKILFAKEYNAHKKAILRAIYSAEVLKDKENRWNRRRVKAWLASRRFAEDFVTYIPNQVAKLVAFASLGITDTAFKVSRWAEKKLADNAGPWGKPMYKGVKWLADKLQ